jgi:hypothetical protein
MTKPTKKPKTIGELLPPDNQKLLSERANYVDKQLDKCVSATKQSVTEICDFLAEIKDKKLWTFLTDPSTGKAFETPEKYASYRLAPLKLGPLKKSKFYEMTAVASLTKGENAISQADVDQLGIKKAALVARVPVEKRTPKLIEAAKSKSVTQVNQLVQDVLNEDLPDDKKKEASVVFARTIAYSVAAELDELEAIGVNMEGIRNSDRSITLVSKFWGCVAIAMRAYYKKELEEAEQFMAAANNDKAKAQASSAGQ